MLEFKMINTKTGLHRTDSKRNLIDCHCKLSGQETSSWIS